MKALVFIDHDIICRHFVQSGVVLPLTRAADVMYVFPEDGGKRFTLDPRALALDAPWVRLPVDTIRQQMWRWVLFTDQLKFRHGDHEASLRRFRRRSLGWKASLLLTVAGLSGFEALFRRWIRSRLAQRPNTALEQMLDRERPDVVIHPSVLEGSFINDLIEECHQRGIPSVVIMNSWDNPSTKRAVVGQPDWLLVWGPQTRDHAIRFVGMRPERTIGFGAAQFDVFRLPPRISRDDLCRRYGFDPAHPVVLFAGANTQTDEFATMRALDDAISSGALPPFNLLYRPHPWGGAGICGERFLGHVFTHVKIDASMRGILEHAARGEKGAITLPDYRDAHDLLAAVDIVVSPLSTIVVEAALHAKPVICFFPSKSDETTQNINSIPLYHFEEFFAVPEVITARDVESLQSALCELAAPPTIASRGARLNVAVQHFVTPFDAPWGDRFAAFILERVLGSR